jgi:putative hemolysin
MIRRLLALTIGVLLAATFLPWTQANAQIEADATPVVPERTPIDVSTDDDSPQPVVTPEQIPSTLEPAGEYCMLRGGILVERFPFAAVDTGSPIALEGSRWFCEFTGSPEAEPPSSRISISLTTLYADQPTLAGSAYLAATAIGVVEGSATPAESYCQSVGGSSRFGVDDNAIGGWASDVSDPANTSISVCVFPDGSAIDDWGLYYRSMGIIRGTNLQDALRQPVDIEVIELFGAP